MSLLHNRSSIIASPHATDQPADTKRCKGRGVRALLNGVPDIILGVHGALTHHFGSPRDILFRLAIEVLGRSCRLIDNPFDLGLRIAGDTAKTFLRFAAEILCSSD